ncbi:MAG: CvpA family protein [Thermoguttaceae bacterium]|jgi:membrane protein required for colicin V production
MTELPIQAYDIFMLVLLAFAVLFGFWKGMAWQIASIGSLVASYFVAARYANELAPSISNEAPWNRYVAMLILYLGTSLVVWMVFRVVARMIDRIQLREFDRQAGALVGLGKGVLLCLVVTFFAVTLSEPARQTVLRTRSGRYMAVFIQRAAPALPREVREQLGQYIDELDRKLRPETPAQEVSPQMLPELVPQALPQSAPQSSPGSTWERLPWRRRSSAGGANGAKSG